MDFITRFVVEHMVTGMAHVVMPIMLASFVLGCTLRLFLYYYARAQNNFTIEFEKRIRANLEMTGGDEMLRPQSFQLFLGDMLDLTRFECFDMPTGRRRKGAENVSSFADRLFLIGDGVTRTVLDTKRLVRFLRRDEASLARLSGVTRTVFDSNPYFNKVVGIFPVGLTHELTNTLPGLFIVGGIFGTFLNISHGLPELGNIDLTRPDEAKQIMDLFLLSVSQSMVKSIVGIFLSVVMSLVNTFFAPEQLYLSALNRYTGTLEMAWNETVNNEASNSFVASAVDTIRKVA
ncbi:MAG: hypothetical protein ACXWQO_00575 [Bdellovibrionota bacterium]